MKRKEALATAAKRWRRVMVLQKNETTGKWSGAASWRPEWKFSGDPQSGRVWATALASEAGVVVVEAKP